MSEEGEVILVEGSQQCVEDGLSLEVEAAHALSALEVVVGRAGEAGGDRSHARGAVGHAGNAGNYLGGGGSDRSCNLGNVAHHAREAGLETDAR